MAYIFLLSVPQTPVRVIAFATRAVNKSTNNKAHVLFLSFCYYTHVLGKCFQSPEFNIYTKSKVRFVQVPSVETA